MLDLLGMGDVVQPRATRPTTAQSERWPVCRGPARAMRR